MRQCAAFHGVWPGTLSRLVNCDQGYVGRGRVLTEFSEAEEKRLVAHIVKLLKLGFGLTTFELMNIMQELMTELRAANPKRKCKWDENMPPYHFAQSFIKRNNLAIRSTSEINKARSCVSKEALRL